MQNYVMKKMKILIFITMCERFLLEPNSNMIIDLQTENLKLLIRQIKRHQICELRNITLYFLHKKLEIFHGLQF